jgi:hypothetical protein
VKLFKPFNVTVEDPVPPGLKAGESVAVMTKSEVVIEKVAPLVWCATGTGVPSDNRSPDGVAVERKLRLVGIDDTTV